MARRRPEARLSFPAPRLDCRHYRGDRPCAPGRVCSGCREHAPIGRRALIIKFGAPGDALRTTPLLERLRREGYGEITWICDRASREVLSLAVGIDRLLVAGEGALAVALTETFDTVFSLDKEPEALALAMLSRSRDKRGFAATPRGRLTIFNAEAGYALRLGIDDELKFKRNRLTVPELVFAMVGYRYAGEEYSLQLPGPAPRRDARRVLLNLGVGARWPNKAWPRERWIDLARRLKADRLRPAFVGGPAERELVRQCARQARVEGCAPAPLGEFAARTAAAAAIVTADSLALHVALAVKTPVVGLFCATSATEIEWFSRGAAIASGRGPCYNPRCGHWPGCMMAIKPAAVLEALRALPVGQSSRLSASRCSDRR